MLNPVSEVKSKKFWRVQTLDPVGQKGQKFLKGSSKTLSRVVVKACQWRSIEVVFLESRVDRRSSFRESSLIGRSSPGKPSSIGRSCRRSSSIGRGRRRPSSIGRGRRRPSLIGRGFSKTAHSSGPALEAGVSSSGKVGDSGGTGTRLTKVLLIVPLGVLTRTTRTSPSAPL